jgi:hypothetical protein
MQIKKIKISLFFSPEDGSDVLPKHQLTFTGQHVFISQKTELFIAAAENHKSNVPL